MIKLHSPTTDSRTLDLQDAALEHLATTCGTVTLPRLRRTHGGRARVEHPHGTLRVLSWVPGTRGRRVYGRYACRRAIGPAVVRTAAGATTLRQRRPRRSTSASTAALLCSVSRAAKTSVTTPDRERRRNSVSRSRCTPSSAR